MKKRIDLIFAAILVLFLIIAGFINNAVLKGILLLLFSAILIFNTAIRLSGKQVDNYKEKFCFGVLLFFEMILASGAIIVIISSLIEA